MSEQRTLLAPGQGIYRQAPTPGEHQKYPMHMAHPGFKPGTVGAEVVSPHGFKYNLPGTAIRFPPVLVMNADQEERHAADGYVPVGRSDPAAFARAATTVVPVTLDYKPVEYPKWAGGVLVNTPEEEQAALAKRAAQAGQKPIDVATGPSAAVVSPAPPIGPDGGWFVVVDAAIDPPAKTAAQIRIEELEAELATTKTALARVVELEARFTALLEQMPEKVEEPPVEASPESTEPAMDNVAGPRTIDDLLAADPTTLSHGEKVKVGRHKAALAKQTAE